MATWVEFARVAPVLAAEGRRLFYQYGVGLGFLATVRADDADTDIEVRPATAADETAVLNLIEELFDPPGSRPPNYSRDRSSTGFRAAVEGADADILLAVRDDHAIGLASVYADIQSIR